MCWANVNVPDGLFFKVAVRKCFLSADKLTERKNLPINKFTRVLLESRGPNFMALSFNLVWRRAPCVLDIFLVSKHFLYAPMKQCQCRSWSSWCRLFGRVNYAACILKPVKNIQGPCFQFSIKTSSRTFETHPHHPRYTLYDKLLAKLHRDGWLEEESYELNLALVTVLWKCHMDTCRKLRPCVIWLSKKKF